VRVEVAVKPGWVNIEPGDGMEFEVVAAERAVEEDGGGGDGGGEKD
jgi:hypothetical protein